MCHRLSFRQLFEFCSEDLNSVSCGLAVGVPKEDILKETHWLLQPGCCPALVQQEQSKVIVGQLVVMVYLDDTVVGGHCFIELAETPECITHAVVCQFVVGVDWKGLSIAGQCLLLPAEIVECITHAVVCIFVVGVDWKGLSIALQRLCVPASIPMLVAFLIPLILGFGWFFGSISQFSSLLLLLWLLRAVNHLLLLHFLDLQ